MDEEVGRAMPVDTKLRLTNGEHVVQLYDHDDELVGIVGGYLTASVLDGDAVLIVAMPEHRAAFAAALAAAGIDVETGRAGGQLTVLDAADTLDRFMVDGSPDVDRFTEVIGGLIRATARSGQQVRVYGEMVALLWDDGNVAGAIELEKLWNRLGAQIPFSLFCAYPSRIMSGAVADAVAEVCHLHSGLVESGCAAQRSAARWFTGAQDTPRLARRFVTETLQRWGRSDLVDSAALVVSELSTNAVLHARSDFTVTVARAGNGIRVAVRDSVEGRLAHRDPSSLEPGGRGLLLIERLADRWGHDLVDGGKIVWAELTTGLPALPSGAAARPG